MLSCIFEVFNSLNIDRTSPPLGHCFNFKVVSSFCCTCTVKHRAFSLWLHFGGVFFSSVPFCCIWITTAVYRKKMVNVLCIITHNLHPRGLDLFKILIKHPHEGLQLWTSRVFTLTNIHSDMNECLSVFIGIVLPTCQHIYWCTEKCHCFLSVCVFVHDPASGHRGCVHRRASILQQPGGHRQPKGSEETQGLSFQEGNWNLQLLLLQHHPGRQA